jgi:sucrose phosphorylase
MRNGVQLITYADRFGGGGINTVRELLTGPLEGVFTGVHLLPFYTPFDGADAGFDPINHRRVDPRLGDWSDVAELSRTHDITADLIVNHMSRDSPEFIDFISHGDSSRFAGMFLERDTVFPDGATKQELAAIYRPRPGDPFTDVIVANGERRAMWTTFTPDQMDLNMSDPLARAYLTDVLDNLADAGVNQIRLDAVGYAVKSPGTSCFMTPDTYRFIDQVGREVSSRGMSSLLEIHAHYAGQIEMAKRTDRVYDFALPPLVLHALYTGSAVHLRQWLEASPRNVITVLDTHDGIGIIDAGPDGDLAGLLSSAEVDQLVGGIHTATDGESRLATGAAASNLDLYQVNSTYFSALGRDDNRYLLARLIQFLTPGVPQVYYAGLLAAGNDVALLDETGVGRDINRPYFTESQIATEMQRPVVRHLMKMARFRNTHPAFGGDFSVGRGSDDELHLCWISESASIEAHINVAAQTFVIDDKRGNTHQTIAEWTEF